MDKEGIWLRVRGFQVRVLAGSNGYNSSVQLTSYNLNSKSLAILMNQLPFLEERPPELFSVGASPGFCEA